MHGAVPEQRFLASRQEWQASGALCLWLGGTLGRGMTNEVAVLARATVLLEIEAIAGRTVGLPKGRMKAKVDRTGRSLHP